MVSQKKGHYWENTGAIGQKTYQWIYINNWKLGVFASANIDHVCQISMNTRCSPWLRVGIVDNMKKGSLFGKPAMMKWAR
jgi:hypothetical protein